MFEVPSSDLGAYCLMHSWVQVSADGVASSPPLSLPYLISPPELSDLLPINVYLFQSNDSTQALLLPPPPLLLPAHNYSNFLPLLWCLSSFCEELIASMLFSSLLANKVGFFSNMGKVNSGDSNIHRWSHCLVSKFIQCCDSATIQVFKVCISKIIYYTYYLYTI